ncbi:MAG: GNAT family N-acetyltransferase [Bacilli bacterium]|nr:GNAT family N-acetyltransferase [Bacilli bacterium]
MIKETNKLETESFLKKYFPDYKITEDPFEKIYIYEEKNCIGLISISIIYERAEINYIVVKEEKRRKKIGTKLLEHALNIMKLKNIKTVSLEVNTTNKAAIKFYEKQGFKIESIRKKYYGKNDAYLMIKELR